MVRVISKVGDIYSVLLNDGTKKYFQYIANDATQLNSEVIRAFKRKYAIEAKPDLEEIIKDEIDFFAHCFIKLGVKRELYIKVGNISQVGTLEILFRGTNDHGHKLGEEPIKVSTNWYVWKINDDKFTHVGKLTMENQNAEIGLVVNPYDIVARMETGKYNFVYPGY
jgi:hypothetical protein